jgi:hypothetical protein
MAQTYLVFDFGSDEAKVQQARHKLDGWRQAFRLDKKLQFKFDRSEVSNSEKSTKPAAESSKGKAAKATKEKSKTVETRAAEQNGEVKLLVRLYFSPHEKLSEQRWIERIPSEEPFKGASPQIVHEGAANFADVLNRFDNLDRKLPRTY